MKKKTPNQVQPIINSLKKSPHNLPTKIPWVGPSFKLQLFFAAHLMTRSMIVEKKKSHYGEVRSCGGLRLLRLPKDGEHNRAKDTPRQSLTVSLVYHLARKHTMSTAFTVAAPTLAKLSRPPKLAGKAQSCRARTVAAVATNTSSSSSASSSVHNKVEEIGRGVALGMTTTAISLAHAQPAHAMEGVLSVFDGNPALVWAARRPAPET